MIDQNQTPSAPDFSAADSEGKVIRLSDYKGRKNVVLVFNRGFF
jgi:peroxiredoxin